MTSLYGAQEGISEIGGRRGTSMSMTGGTYDPAGDLALNHGDSRDICLSAKSTFVLATAQFGPS